MHFPSPLEACELLLGGTPDRIETLVAWSDHRAYGVEMSGAVFVVKVDADAELIEREVAGHRRAATAGIPVPELVAVAENCMATRFVVGTALTERSSEAAWRAAGGALRKVHDLAPASLIGNGFDLLCTAWPDFVAALLARELDGCVRQLAFDPNQAERIRRAFDEAGSRLERRPIAWCHGDCQPEHVLLDLHDDSIVAIIDWADHGKADPMWDLAVVSLDDTAHLDALLEGHGGADDDVRSVMSLYRVLRWLGESRWLAARSHPGAAVSLERAATWSAPD